MEVILLVFGVLVVLLIFQRWFWILLFSLGVIASFFAMIASVIHFQIFGAIGFLILMLILMWIRDIIGGKY